MGFSSFFNRKSKAEYKLENQLWLEKKSKEEGVLSLPKGILYREIKTGDKTGVCPTSRSIIQAHYTGRTIDGKVFDSSRDSNVPLACRLSDLIEGWIIAISQMHVGDIWEIYIPSEMGYGKYSQPGIPANSTLIFEIELISVDK